MLSQDNLEHFRRALAVALRTTREADDSLNDRFVELRPGMLGTLGAPVNNLITGRRGVGKSTTLAILQRRAKDVGSRVIFVDVEHHKSREYPTVLIEILSDILRTARPRLTKASGWKTRRRLNRITRFLSALKDLAPEVTEDTESARDSRRQMGVVLRGGVARNFTRITADIGAARSKSSRTSVSSTRIYKKEDLLRDILPQISSALERATEAAGFESTLVVLDDFYFIEREAQPLVLDYLHAATKRSNVWLKIGSVRSRTQTFSDGNPPIGMQPPHDLQPLSLDVSLADFATAKKFLEDVTDGALDMTGIQVSRALSPVARDRAVLITGGAVARDYMALLMDAADKAWEDIQRKGATPDSFQIQAEHIQAAAGIRLDRKLSDLENDAGRESNALRERFEDILRFVRGCDSNYYFLLERDNLDTAWGRQIKELEDLRFVHQILNTRPNTGTWRGREVLVYMVDMAAIVNKRVQAAPIEFWKPRQSDKLRRAEWVYSPSIDDNQRSRTSAARKKSPKELRSEQSEVEGTASMPPLPIDGLGEHK